MNSNFVNIGNNDDKVIEECAEVIQAIIKIKRFGLMNFHPDRPESNNKIEVLSEIKDLRIALDNYEEFLNNINDKHTKEE
jgi:hypothetical protein